MRRALDTIFSPLVLLIVNIAVILLAEFSGGGTFFFRSGIIHLIAVLFIMLAAARIFFHYYTFDPIYEKFVHAAIAAFAVFSASHIIEFTGIVFFGIYRDAVFAQVVNLYLVSLLLMLLGVKTFFRARRHSGRTIRPLLVAGIMAALIITALLWINDRLITLEAGTAVPFIYAALVLAVTLQTIKDMMRIKKLVSFPHAFVNGMLWAVIAITLAALPYIFYEILQRAGIPEIQLIYVSHFIFYGALSLIFLAFGKLSYLGGVYEDIRKGPTAKT